jgi:mono/diheme cytochrome c family protein
MGDMLVKSGDWRTGVRVYALARGMGSYPRWAFRDVLEARIARAEENVAAFRRPEAAGADGARPMLGSRFSCVACHQQ